MHKRSKIVMALCVTATGVLISFVIWLTFQSAEYGFCREVPESEQELRQTVVDTAASYLGCNESDGSHKKIIDLYNQQASLPLNYMVTYTDKWCATFASVVAIQCGFTNFIPVECGCERQINLFQSINRWNESDAYIPLPGDYIFYHTEHSGDDDCNHWSDHVGIVVGVWNNHIKVIEGNCYKEVRYRIIPVNDESIRGFGIPDYSSLSNECNTPACSNTSRGYFGNYFARNPTFL